MIFVYWIESFFILVRALQTSISGFQAKYSEKANWKFFLFSEIYPHALLPQNDLEIFFCWVFTNEMEKVAKSTWNFSDSFISEVVFDFFLFSCLFGGFLNKKKVKIEWKNKQFWYEKCALNFQFPNLSHKP